MILNRIRIASLFGMILVCFVPVLVSADSHAKEMMRKDAERSDLIVKGVIVGTSDAEAEHSKLFSVERADSPNFPVTILHVNVTEALKGSWEDKVLTVLVPGNPEAGEWVSSLVYDYQSGDKVILCLKYAPDVLDGVFKISGSGENFVLRGGTWIVRDRPNQTVNLLELREAIHAYQPEAMVAAADAVVSGRVVELSSKPFGCGYATDCVADYVTVLVEDSWKGPATGTRVLVRVLRRGSTLPWYTTMPQLELNSDYLMFLRADEIGYYPSWGFNGFLRIDGDRLIANETLEYPLSRRGLIDRVMEEAKP